MMTRPPTSQSFRIVAQPPNGFQRDFDVRPSLDGDAVQGRAGFALVSNPVMIAYKLEVVDGDTVKKALRFQKLVSAPRM